MANKDMELFDGEWAILKVVWEHEPVTAPTVQEFLQKERNWAYATDKNPDGLKKWRGTDERKRTEEVS